MEIDEGAAQRHPARQVSQGRNGQGVTLQRRAGDEAAGPRSVSYLLIVNPTAGKGDGIERAEALANSLPDGDESRIEETQEKGSAIELAERHGGDLDRIIAVGGDGTLNEVVTGLMRLRRSGSEVAALGFLPSGTANATARAFELADDPETVGGILPDAKVAPIDVGVVEHEGGERPFLVRVGAGLDAAIFKRLDASRTGVLGYLGLMRTLPEVIRTLRSYPGPPIEVTVDDRPFAHAISVIVPNVGEVGFHATISEDADPADGLIDVLALSIDSNWSMLRLTAQMITTSLENAHDVHVTRGRRVSLKSPGDAPFQVDGEPVGTLPVSIRLEPRALRLLLTAEDGS